MYKRNIVSCVSNWFFFLTLRFPALSGLACWSSRKDSQPSFFYKLFSDEVPSVKVSSSCQFLFVCIKILFHVNVVISFLVNNSICKLMLIVLIFILRLSPFIFVPSYFYISFSILSKEISLFSSTQVFYFSNFSSKFFIFHLEENFLWCGLCFQVASLCKIICEQWLSLLLPPPQRVDCPSQCLNYYLG